MRDEKMNARHKKILGVLADQGRVRVSTLGAMFDVSGETLRKDLIAMEKQRVLVRRHGLVERVEGDAEQTIDERAATNLDTKRRIARAALDFIPNGAGDVIGIDAGSSAHCLAQLLAKRRNQTIVTHSMDVAGAFLGSHLSNSVYLTGGAMRVVDRSFYGPWAIKSLQSVRMKVAVLGTYGTLGWDGLGAVSYDDAAVKQAYSLNSDRVIALFDSDKFSTGTLIEAISWDDIDVIITDSGIAARDRERIAARAQLVIV